VVRREKSELRPFLTLASIAAALLIDVLSSMPPGVAALQDVSYTPVTLILVLSTT